MVFCQKKKNGSLILKQVNIELHIGTSDRTPNEKVGSVGQLAHQLPKQKMWIFCVKRLMEGHDGNIVTYPIVFFSVFMK